MDGLPSLSGLRWSTTRFTGLPPCADKRRPLRVSGRALLEMAAGNSPGNYLTAAKRALATTTRVDCTAPDFMRDEDAMTDAPDFRETERCDGRYLVPQTSPPRDEPFDVTYRCALPHGHDGPHGGVLGPHGPLTWKQVAQRLGEELASSGPEGYYAFKPNAWLTWAFDAIACLRQRAEQAEKDYTEVRGALTDAIQRAEQAERERDEAVKMNTWYEKRCAWYQDEQGNAEARVTALEQE